MSGGVGWRSLLLRIGDKCPEYGGGTDHREHIETCYGALWREFEHSQDEIYKLLLECAEQLPHKAPFYGVLVGLINLENEDFAKRVVDATQSNLQVALDTEDCDRVRIMLRFLACLMCSKVVLPSSVIGAFDELLSSAMMIVDEDAGNMAWQPQADFYIYCILSCLPWGGLDLAEQVTEEFERILVGVQSYLSIRHHARDAGYSVFESTDDGKSLNEKDFIEDLWDRIEKFSRSGWKDSSVPKPHLSFEAQLVAGKSHGQAPIRCKMPDSSARHSEVLIEQEKHKAELKYPTRLRRLNIFPPSKVETAQPIDRFVVEEYLLDVLLFFNGCRKECAFYLVSLPVSFRYEYLMAETIFSQILLLPEPPFRPIYYTLVIIDLCKALPGAFPSVVVGAVHALFNRINDMDMECRTRLILWFSHHLSNFQYIWPWQEWAYVKDLPKWAPKRVFVQEVLEREIRLSYYDKIKQSIEAAQELEELLPPKGGPNFKYAGNENQDSSPGFKLSKDLNNLVRGKKTMREISLWVEESILPMHDSTLALEVVVQTLLDIGSKSFTHFLTVLERYGQVIAKICSNEEMQLLLMTEICSYWKNNTQMAAIAIDRMMGYRIISNLAIVKWVFSSINADQFHVSDHPWEILRSAVNKTYNKISDLRREIVTLEKGLKAAEEQASKAIKDLQDAESKLEIVDGEPTLVEKPGRLKRLKGYAEKGKDEVVALRESLEAKEALLARGLEESKQLLSSLYENFVSVLSTQLPPVSADGQVPNLRAAVGAIDSMSVDEVPTESQEKTTENGSANNRNGKDEKGNSEYNIGELEQWCLCTLGYLKSFTRQYATEIWSQIAAIDEIVCAEGVHPLTRRAVFSGLCRQANN